MAFLSILFFVGVYQSFDFVGLPFDYGLYYISQVHFFFGLMMPRYDTVVSEDVHPQTH